MPLASDSGPSRFSFIFPRRSVSRFGENFMRETISFAVSIVYDNPGGGILPYIGYIGMCGTKGYGFSPLLVINRISILADFGHGFCTLTLI